MRTAESYFVPLLKRPDVGHLLPSFYYRHLASTVLIMVEPAEL